MSGYCVPVDMVEQILHRLPPKSVGKCMAVCKSWNLLIKSHNFLSSYQHQHRSLFLVKTSWYQYHCLSSSPSNMIECSSFFSTPGDEYRFVGAVNGLVCLTSYEKGNFILFNPLTWRSTLFPMSQTMCDSDLDFEPCWNFGFGFDSKKNDFKVVQTIYTNGCKVPPTVVLYSLNEGVWRVLNNTPFRKPIVNLDEDLLVDVNRHCGQQLFFQDSVHWLVCNTKMYYPFRIVENYHIAIFNVVEEKFSEMELPQVLARSFRRLDITVIDGCLSVVEYPQEPGDNTNIWMKREESWSKIYSFSLSGANIIKLLGQNMSSEVLVLPSSWSNSDTKLMSLHSYDLKSQEIRDVKSSSIDLCASDFTYNLILLDKENYVDVSGEAKSRQKLKRKKLIDDDDHYQAKSWQKLKRKKLIDDDHYQAKSRQKLERNKLIDDDHCQSSGKAKSRQKLKRKKLIDDDYYQSSGEAKSRQKLKRKKLN